MTVKRENQQGGRVTKECQLRVIAFMLRAYYHSTEAPVSLVTDTNKLVLAVMNIDRYRHDEDLPWEQAHCSRGTIP